MAKAKPTAADPLTESAAPPTSAEPVEVPALSQLGSTFAERAKAREATAKRVGSSENKAVNPGGPVSSKSRRGG